MAFNVTAAAAQEILAAAVRSNMAGMALRIAARTTDDGLDFGMGFDEAREEDAVSEFEGLTVLVGPTSQPLLDGLMLDFVEVEPGERSFVFTADPEPPSEPASSSCASQRRGCGSGGCSGCGG